MNPLALVLTGWRWVVGAILGIGAAVVWRNRKQEGRDEVRAEQTIRDLAAVASRAESDDRVRDPGVVTELRRRHTRPE